MHKISVRDDKLKLFIGEHYSHEDDTRSDLREIEKGDGKENSAKSRKAGSSTDMEMNQLKSDSLVSDHKEDDEPSEVCQFLLFSVIFFSLRSFFFHRFGTSRFQALAQ